MKLWRQITFYTALTVAFSGCLGSKPTPKESAKIDDTLPVVKLTDRGLIQERSSIAFEWNSIKDSRVKGIFIYRDRLGDAETTHAYQDTITNRFSTHYVDTTVEPSSEYSYFFTTFTDDEESKQSQLYRAKTLAQMQAITWIHAVQNMPRTAKIIWRPHSSKSVKSYKLERMIDKEQGWQKWATVDGRLNVEYIDLELKDNFIYEYRIIAVDFNNDESVPSKVVKVVTKPLPKTITGIKTSKNLPKKIAISWDKSMNKDFSHYNIYRSSKTIKWYEHIVKTPFNNHIDKIQEDGKTYFYRVSIVDNDGLESHYEELSTQGITLAKPEAPSMFEGSLVDGVVELRWGNVDKRVRSYSVIKRVPTGILSSEAKEFVKLHDMNFKDKELLEDTKYSYQVCGVDEFGIKSKPSASIEIYVPKQAVVVPMESIEVERPTQEPTQPTPEVQDSVEQQVNMLDMSEI